MEHRFMELKKMLSNLAPNKTAQKNHVDTQSLSVQIKVAVDQEVRVETRSRSRSNRTPERRRRSKDRKRSGHRKNRRRDRSADRDNRKRSRSPRRRRRDYSTDRERSNSHSRRRRNYSTDSEDRKRSKSRSRRDYSTERDDRRRSRRRSSDRESESRNEYRQKTRYKVEGGRSRSRSRRDSYSSDRNLNQSKNDRNSREDQLDEFPCGLFEPSKVGATDYEDRSNVKNALNAFKSTSTTITKEEYRSSVTRISETQSSVVDGNDISSEESIQSNFEMTIDETIFNKVLARALSSNAKHSSSSDDIALASDDSMQYTEMSPIITNIESAETLFDQIKDPRLRKMIQVQAAISSPQQPHQQQPFETQSYEHQPHQSHEHQTHQLHEHQPHQSYEHQPQQHHSHKPDQQKPHQQQPYEHQPHQSHQHQPIQHHSHKLNQQKPHQQKPHRPQPHQQKKQTLSSERINAQWKKSRERYEIESTPTTYGEYKKQQARSEFSEIEDKTEVPESTPTTETGASDMISTVNSSESTHTPKLSKLVPEAEKLINPTKVMELEVVAYANSSNKQTGSVMLREQPNGIPKPKNTKNRKETGERHATPGKCETNEVKSGHEKMQKEATEKKTTVHEKNNSFQTTEQSSAVKLEQNVNATVNQESSSSSHQALIDLTNRIDPTNLHTLIGLMKQLTENKSLAEVKEALTKCIKTDETTTINTGDIQPVLEQQLDSTESASNSNRTKVKKNEADKLREDINNTSIRDGVLNAYGRRRNFSKVAIDYTMEYCDGDEDDDDYRETPSPTLQARIKKESVKKAPAKKSPVKKSPVKKSPVKKSHVKKSTEKKASNKKPAIKRGPRIINKHFTYSATTLNDSEMSSDGVDPVILLTRLVPPTKSPRVRNNNPDWHSLKNALPCQICYDPPGISLISHYVNFHPNDEVLNSRLSPEAAQRLRSSTDFPQCEEIKPDGVVVYKQFCYFCNTSGIHTKTEWIRHMIIHTGYFEYKCNGCSRKFSTRATYHACHPNSAIEKITQPIFQQPNIMAYVCELCNYVRFHEEEIQQHLNNEHDIDELREFKKLKFCTIPLGYKKGRPRKDVRH